MQGERLRTDDLPDEELFRQYEPATLEPAIETDNRGRITGWSAEAEQLLGRGAETALGRQLQDVLLARDLFGNRICRWGCSFLEMRRRSEEIRPFVVDVLRSTGNVVRVVVRVAVEDGDGHGIRIVYRLRPDSRRRMNDRRALEATPVAALLSSAGMPASTPRVRDLTPAEVRVLRLLASGNSATQVAKALFISPATARNHVQHILEKLGVHSQLHAVTVAIRQGLV